MTVDWKKKLLPNLPYLLFVYLFDKLCQAVRLAPGLDASEKFLHLSQGFTEAFSSGLPSLYPLDLLVGIAGAVVVRLAVYAKGKNARKYRRGIEYGSARWGTAADIAPYVDPVPDWNIPLTQTEKLTMSSRPKNPKYARNKNILVIGGSGSGKTRFFVKPSLMQMHSSYVVTDPKGQLLSEVGTMLRRGAPKLDENGKPMRDARGKVIYEPYRIKVLNTINFKKSMKYNPFAYIRSEKDILKLVNVIIANTKGDGEKSSEDFWVKAERLLYCALIGYIWYEAEPEEKNFLTLLELINASEAREDDEEFQSPVDLLFAKLEKEHPDHFAVKQYRKFKLAAGRAAVYFDFIIIGFKVFHIVAQLRRGIWQYPDQGTVVIPDKPLLAFDSGGNDLVKISVPSDQELHILLFQKQCMNQRLHTILRLTKCRDDPVSKKTNGKYVHGSIFAIFKPASPTK